MDDLHQFAVGTFERMCVMQRIERVDRDLYYDTGRNLLALGPEIAMPLPELEPVYVFQDHYIGTPVFCEIDDVDDAGML